MSKLAGGRRTASGSLPRAPTVGDDAETAETGEERRPSRGFGDGRKARGPISRRRPAGISVAIVERVERVGDTVRHRIVDRNRQVGGHGIDIRASKGDNGQPLGGVFIDKRSSTRIDERRKIETNTARSRAIK